MSRLVPPSDFTTVAVSGGFDPIHKGHVRMIREASEHGYVIVIVNSDEWLMRKKGYVFMSFEERAEILNAIDDDGTVCENLRRLKPDAFANGGDRKGDNVPEVSVCKELGIKMLWNVGGEKTQSSSELVAKQKENKNE